eukprot:3652306-Rhodomonas_salina.1
MNRRDTCPRYTACPPPSAVSIGDHRNAWFRRFKAAAAQNVRLVNLVLEECWGGFWGGRDLQLVGCHVPLQHQHVEPRNVPAVHRLSNTHTDTLVSVLSMIAGIRAKERHATARPSRQRSHSKMSAQTRDHDARAKARTWILEARKLRRRKRVSCRPQCPRMHACPPRPPRHNHAHTTHHNTKHIARRLVIRVSRLGFKASGPSSLENLKGSHTWTRSAASNSISAIWSSRSALASSRARWPR